MSQLTGLQFGSGLVFATPLTSSGNPPTNPTAQQVGVVQNVKCNFGAAIKELFGQSQYPVDTAIGKRSIKGSFEFAQISNGLLSQLFTADPITTGVVKIVVNETGTVPASPYAVTVTHSATWLADEGVQYASTGIALTKVASGPTVGQYSVSAGVYTFAAADTTLGMLISYRWTDSTSGTTLTANNHPMGYGPIVSLDLDFPYDGGIISFNFPYARLGKIDGSTKIDDYTMWQTDWTAFAGPDGVAFRSYNSQ